MLGTIMENQGCMKLPVLAIPLFLPCILNFELNTAITGEWNMQRKTSIRRHSKYMR